MQKSTHDEVDASRFCNRFAGIYRKGGALMTVYETMMVALEVIGSLISFGMLVVALLNFLDKRSRRK